MIDVAFDIALLLMGSGVGYWCGAKRRKSTPPAYEHEHVWEPWQIVSEGTEKTTRRMRRMCPLCGDIEDKGGKALTKCPPHEWGVWHDQQLTDGSGQKRTCERCGISELRKMRTNSNDV